MPIFADVQNVIDFSVQPSFAPALRDYAKPLYWLYKRKKIPSLVARDYLNLILRRALAFRGAYLSREGKLISEIDVAHGLKVGDFFSVNINESLAARGVTIRDGLFVLIANRGRTDMWSSSPGSLNVRYIGERSVAGFRIGLFARTLNPAGSKRHFGFTGLNPQIRINGHDSPSVLLINHSSDPDYDRAVTPVIRLHKSRDDYLEQPFGTIPAHGALERGICDLFPEAQEFLAPVQGVGFAVTRAQGATLASLHLIRTRDGATMAIEHSRPAHTNVVSYF